MAQQTAVEWLYEQIPFEWSSSRAAFEALQQAKAMEKEQITEAYCNGNDNIGAEQYYNETYQSNKD
jgi:hypothetical protein